MAVPTQVVLSGSTDGMPIVIAATATTVHTAGATGYDKVWLWASNVTAAVATLTVEWGAATDPAGYLIKAYSIPANSAPIPIATGQAIKNSKVVKALSGTASAINVTGYAIQVA